MAFIKSSSLRSSLCLILASAVSTNALAQVGQAEPKIEWTSKDGPQPIGEPILIAREWHVLSLLTNERVDPNDEDKVTKAGITSYLFSDITQDHPGIHQTYTTNYLDSASLDDGKIQVLVTRAFQLTEAEFRKKYDKGKLPEEIEEFIKAWMTRDPSLEIIYRNLDREEFPDAKSLQDVPVVAGFENFTPPEVIIDRRGHINLKEKTASVKATEKELRNKIIEEYRNPRPYSPAYRFGVNQQVYDSWYNYFRTLKAKDGTPYNYSDAQIRDQIAMKGVYLETRQERPLRAFLNRWKSQFETIKHELVMEAFPRFLAQFGMFMAVGEAGRPLGLGGLSEEELEKKFNALLVKELNSFGHHPESILNKSWDSNFHKFGFKIQTEYYPWESSGFMAYLYWKRVKLGQLKEEMRKNYDNGVLSKLASTWYPARNITRDDIKKFISHHEDARNLVIDPAQRKAMGEAVKEHKLACEKNPGTPLVSPWNLYRHVNLSNIHWDAETPLLSDLNILYTDNPTYEIFVEPTKIKTRKLRIKAPTFGEMDRAIENGSEGAREILAHREGRVRTVIEQVFKGETTNEIIDRLTLARREAQNSTKEYLQNKYDEYTDKFKKNTLDALAIQRARLYEIAMLMKDDPTLNDDNIFEGLKILIQAMMEQTAEKMADGSVFHSKDYSDFELSAVVSDLLKTQGNEVLGNRSDAQIKAPENIQKVAASIGDSEPRKLFLTRVLGFSLWLISDYIRSNDFSEELKSAYAFFEEVTEMKGEQRHLRDGVNLENAISQFKEKLPYLEATDLGWVSSFPSANERDKAEFTISDGKVDTKTMTNTERQALLASLFKGESYPAGVLKGRVISDYDENARDGLTLYLIEDAKTETFVNDFYNQQLDVEDFLKNSMGQEQMYKAKCRIIADHAISIQPEYGGERIGGDAFAKLLMGEDCSRFRRAHSNYSR